MTAQFEKEVHHKHCTYGMFESGPRGKNSEVKTKDKRGIE